MLAVELIQGRELDRTLAPGRGQAQELGQQITELAPGLLHTDFDPDDFDLIGNYSECK